MLNYNDNYSIGWAQRQCIENQPEDKMMEYIEWFRENILGIISTEQADRLLWDIKRNYIPSETLLAKTYPEEHSIPQALYTYMDMLENVKSSPEDLTADEDKPETCDTVNDVWPLVKWAALYCMGRKSYAASYINDVMSVYYERLTQEQVKELADTVREYKEWCEEIDRKFVEENPDYYVKHPYMRDDSPSKEWIRFLDFADPDNRKLLRFSPDLIDKDTFEPITPRPENITVYERLAFWNSTDNTWDPVDEYIKHPYRHYFIDSNTIINK